MTRAYENSKVLQSDIKSQDLTLINSDNYYYYITWIKYIEPLYFYLSSINPSYIQIQQ